MKVRDVMTRGAVSVTPDCAIADLASKMNEHRISGVPVVDMAGRLVGVVTEGDLLRRAELGTARKRSLWKTFFSAQGTLAEEYIRSHGRKVAEVMSVDPISVGEDTPLEDVIHLMEKHRIKRLPVVTHGELVGIVSRANLVQALAGLLRSGGPLHEDDISIRDAVRTELARLPWPAKEFVSVTVKDGIVDLWGTFTAFRQDEAAVIAAQNVSGVREVRNHLAWVDPMSGLVVYSADEKLVSGLKE